MSLFTHDPRVRHQLNKLIERGLGSVPEPKWRIRLRELAKLRKQNRLEKKKGTPDAS
jgi:hypothetical protein